MTKCAADLIEHWAGAPRRQSIRLPRLLFAGPRDGEESPAARTGLPAGG